MTKAQQRLLDQIKGKGQVPVRGAQLRVAENLAKQGMVIMGNHGAPWNKGWYIHAEHIDDYMRRTEDDLLAAEAGAEAALIGSAQEGQC